MRIRLSHALTCLLFFGAVPLGAEPLQLTLPLAVKIGTDANLELKKLRMEIFFKKLAAREAWRAFLPQFGVSFNRAVTVRIHEQDSRQHKTEFSIDQLLFDGGKTSAASSLARADWMITARLYETEALTTRLMILTAYAKVIGGRENVRIYGDFLAASAKELDLANLEVTLGTTTALDRDEVSTRYESAKLELLQSNEDYQTALVEFRRLLRLPVGTELQLAGTVEEGFEPVPLQYTETQLYALAKQHRIDFIKSLLAYQKAHYEYKTVYRSWLPDISLSTKFFMSGPTLLPTEKGYSAYINFSFPLFGSPASGNTALSGGDGTTTTSSLSLSPFRDISYLRQLTQMRSALFFTKIERDELPEQVRREIKLAMVSLDIAARKLEIREKQLAVIRKRITLLELKIKLGESRRLDLAKARIELYQALVEKTNGIVNYLNTAMKMETVVGLKPGDLKLFRSAVFTFR